MHSTKFEQLFEKLATKLDCKELVEKLMRSHERDAVNAVHPAIAFEAGVGVALEAIQAADLTQAEVELLLARTIDRLAVSELLSRLLAAKTASEDAI